MVVHPVSNAGPVDAEGFDSSRFRNVIGDGWWRGMAEQKSLRAGAKIAHPRLSGPTGLATERGGRARYFHRIARKPLPVERNPATH